MNIFIIIKITKSARFRKKFQTRQEENESENNQLDIIEEEDAEVNENPEVNVCFYANPVKNWPKTPKSQCFSLRKFSNNNFKLFAPKLPFFQLLYLFHQI